MTAHARVACRPSPQLLLLALLLAGAWAPGDGAGLSRAARCPCLPAALCPHAFGSSPDDARLLGRQPRCPPLARPAGAAPARHLVRCCAASTRSERGGVTLRTDRLGKPTGPVYVRKPHISVSAKVEERPPALKSSLPPPQQPSPATSLPPSPAPPTVSEENSTASSAHTTTNPTVSTATPTSSTLAPLVPSPHLTTTSAQTADPNFSTTTEPPRPVYIPQTAQPSVRSVSKSDTLQSLASTKLETHDTDYVISQDEATSDNSSYILTTSMPSTTLLSIANDTMGNEAETTTQLMEPLATESVRISFDNDETFTDSFSDLTTTDVSTTEDSTTPAAMEADFTQTPVTVPSDTRSPAVEKISPESTTANIDDYPRTELSDVGTTTEYLQDNSTYQFIHETTTEITISSEFTDIPFTEKDKSPLDVILENKTIPYDKNQKNITQTEKILRNIPLSVENAESSTRDSIEIEIETEMTTSKYESTDNINFGEKENSDDAIETRTGDFLLLNEANEGLKDFQNTSNNLTQNDTEDEKTSNEQTLQTGLLNMIKEENDTILNNSTVTKMFQIIDLKNETAVKENKILDEIEMNTTTNNVENDNSIITTLPSTTMGSSEETFTDAPSTDENVTSDRADIDIVTTEIPLTTETQVDVTTNTPQATLSPGGNPEPLEEKGDEEVSIGRKTARRLRPFLIVEDDLEDPPRIEEDHEDNAVDPLQEFVKLFQPKPSPTLPPSPPPPPSRRRRPPVPSRPPPPTCPPSILQSTQHAVTETPSTTSTGDGLVVVTPSPSNSTPATDVLLVYPCSLSNVPDDEENMTIVFADTLGGVNDLYATTEENKNPLDTMKPSTSMSVMNLLQQKHTVTKVLGDNDLENDLESFHEANLLLHGNDESHSISASEHIHHVLSPEVPSTTEINEEQTTVNPIFETRKRTNSLSRFQPVTFREMNQAETTRTHATGLFARRPHPGLLRTTNGDSSSTASRTTTEAATSSNQPQRIRVPIMKPLHFRQRPSNVQSTHTTESPPKTADDHISADQQNLMPLHPIPSTTTPTPTSKSTPSSISDLHRNLSMSSNLNRGTLHSSKGLRDLPIVTSPVPTNPISSSHSPATSNTGTITTTARPGLRFRHPPPASALLSKANTTRGSVNTKGAELVIHMRKVIKVFKRPVVATTAAAAPHRPSSTSSPPPASSFRPAMRRPPPRPFPAAQDGGDDGFKAAQVPLAVRVRGEYPFARPLAPRVPLTASPAQVQEAQTLNGIVTAEGSLAKHLLQVVAGLRRLTLGQRHDAVSSTTSTPPFSQPPPTIHPATPTPVIVLAVFKLRGGWLTARRYESGKSL